MTRTAPTWLGLALMVLAVGCRGNPDQPDATPDEVDSAPSGNSTLAALTSSLGVLDPPFEPEVTQYGLDLALTADAVELAATAAVPTGTTILIDDVATLSGAPRSLPLTPGGRDVDIVVTAANGDATTYRIHVRRGMPGITASAAGAALHHPVTPGFEPGTTSYTMAVGLLLQRVQITVVPPIAGSTITVAGGNVVAGEPSAPVALNLGLTPIPIVVTPPGGTAVPYTLNVNRAGAILQQAYAKASNTEPVSATGSDQFGYVVALSGDTLAVGALREASAATGVDGIQSDNSADLSGAVYVFARVGTAWSQQAYLKASNTEANDQFASAVALWGDTLAVGAPNESSAATGVGGDQANNNASQSGAVYVFTRTAGTWSQQAYLKASNTGYGGSFGGSVALSGDTLAVGAAGEDSMATGVGGDQDDNTAFGAGAVYVFTRTGTTWSQQAYIKASNTQADDYFGRSVALWGDTLAVGAPAEDSAAILIDGDQASNSASSSGAVYVFARTGSSWQQQAYVKALNTGADDQFGLSVGLWGDTLAVGAHGEDSNGTSHTDNSTSGSGAVYVFSRVDTVWALQAYLKAANPGVGDELGRSVALWGDTVAVGAYREDSAATGVNGTETDNSAQDSGAAYVFTRTSTTWSQQAYVKASNTDLYDGLGASVALWADTIAVGAVYEDSAATGVGGNQSDNSTSNSGAVYVLR